MYVRQPEVQRNKIILLDMILMCYVHDIYILVYHPLVP